MRAVPWSLETRGIPGTSQRARNATELVYLRCPAQTFRRWPKVFLHSMIEILESTLPVNKIGQHRVHRKIAELYLSIEVQSRVSNFLHPFGDFDKVLHGPRVVPALIAFSHRIRASSSSKRGCRPCSVPPEGARTIAQHARSESEARALYIKFSYVGSHIGQPIDKNWLGFACAQTEISAEAFKKCSCSRRPPLNEDARYAKRIRIQCTGSLAEDAQEWSAAASFGIPPLRGFKLPRLHCLHSIFTRKGYVVLIGKLLIPWTTRLWKLRDRRGIGAHQMFQEFR